jgi:stage V sporulation protein B
MGSYAGVVLNYALVLVVTQFLAPADYGVFTLGQTVVNLSMVLVLFGTPKALDRFIPQYQALGESGKVRTLIIRVLRWVALASLIVMALLFFSSSLLATWFSEPGFTYVLRVLLLALPATALVREVSSVFVGYKELRYRVCFEVVFIPFLKLLLGSIVLLAGFGLMGWVWVFSCATVGGAIVALSTFYRKVWKPIQAYPPQAINSRDVLSYAWPLSLSSVLLLVTGQIEPLFLGYYHSATDVGVFRVYVYVISLIGVIKTSFAQIFKPVAASLAAQDDFQGLSELYVRVAKWLFQFNLAILLLFVILGKDILEILFPADYLVGIGALLVLLAGRFLNSAFGPEGMLLEALDHTKLSLLNSLVMLGTNCALDYVLIPRYGILGAAVGAASAIVVGGLAGVLELFIKYRLQPFEWQHVKHLLIGAFCTFVVYALKERLGEGVLGVSVKSLVFMALYVLGLFLGGGVDSVDYRLLKRIYGRLANRKQMRIGGS